MIKMDKLGRPIETEDEVCPVCAHPERTIIESMVYLRFSYSAISSHTGIDSIKIARHVLRHM